MKAVKSLVLFAATERDETADFAFYLAIKQLSHEGVIHNWKLIQSNLCKRICLSDSQFRILKANCIKKGYLWEEKKHLRIKSQQKIFLSLKEKFPQCFEKKGYCKSFLTKMSNYKLLKDWIKGAFLYNNGVQQEYNKLSRVERKKKASYNKSAFDKVQFTISRERISFHFGYLSKNSASYLVRKLNQLGFIDNDERFSKMIRPISYLEYKMYFILNGKFFYKNGFLYQNLVNLLSISSISYYQR